MTKNYFAILGNNTTLALKELELRNPQNIEHYKKNTILFETKKNPEKLPPLAGIIKRGIIHNATKIKKVIEKYDIIGVEHNSTGLFFKKKYNVKRYKLVPINKTDKEIKKKGKEIIEIKNNTYGVVEKYQNIKLYEKIDFEKPSQGMQVGMMPSKLAHQLMNIANIYAPVSKTVYDPFCGFGTTCFVANAHGFNTIGSDINITITKPNIKRWKKNKYAKTNPITIFKHNVLEEITKNFVENADIIVTEGRLGPVTKQKPNTKEVEKNYKKITKMYTSLFHNITKLKNNKKRAATICIPDYGPDFEQIKNQYIQKMEGPRNIIDQKLLYKRKRQKVGRYILILTNS